MSPTAPQNDWTTCPPNEVRGLARRLGRRRTLEQIRKGAALATALLLIAFVGIYSTGMLTKSDGNYAGIACRTVIENADEYLRGTLDADLQQQITEHLRLCEKCRDHMPAGDETASIVRPIRSDEVRQFPTVVMSVVTSTDIR